MDAQLKAQLQQTVTRATFQGYSTDGYAEPAYSTSASVTVRIVGRSRMVYDAQGQQMLSDKQLVSEDAFTLQDLVWLPGESTSANPGWTILTVAERVDEHGDTDHYITWLGRGQGIGG